MAAALLLQRSPAARTLYWKVVLAPLPEHAGGGGGGGAWQAGQHNQQLQHHLHSWLALQLQCGRPVGAACGSAFVEGPLPLHAAAAGGGDDGGSGRSSAVAELSTCVAVPASGSGSSVWASALAGASGVVVALPTGPIIDAGVVQQVQQWLPQRPGPGPGAEALPALLVAASDAAAEQWQQQLSSSGSCCDGPVQVLSVQEVASGAAAAVDALVGSSNGSCNGIDSSSAAHPRFSRQQLVRGLRWLAAQAPPQPMLRVSTGRALELACHGTIATGWGAAWPI